MHDTTIGFIGAGQMAQALARGIVAAGLMPAARLLAADPAAAARQQIATDVPGLRLVDKNAGSVSQADLIVLAVKPHLVSTVASQIQLRDDQLLVSIAAGVRLEQFAAVFQVPRIVRVMPNTPCLVGLGASAFCLSAGARVEDGERVRQILEAVGLAVQVEERLLDAVTGLSGSGPAYVYLIIEALSDGGVRMGLPRETATRLAAQTVLGAARMVLDNSGHPAELRERVTSPGGTTSAGLQVLEDRATRAALIAAVQAATLRSAELGRPPDASPVSSEP